MTDRRLVLVGQKLAGSSTLRMSYDSRHDWVSGNAEAEPDYDLIRKQRIEQDLADGYQEADYQERGPLA